MKLINFKEKLENFWHRFKLFLIVIGPGIITAVADNDAGGVATYTVGASLYGMSSRFLIIPVTLLLAITQLIGAKIAIVAKKGLGDLIRERYGIKMSLFIFFLYYLINQGVVLQNISGLKASLQLFNLPWQPMLIFLCFLLIILIIVLDYKKLERVFILMIFFYISYIVSAILAKPNWSEALHQSLILPDKKYWFNLSFWFTHIAVLGTTITAWGQFFVQSYIVDKKLGVQHLKTEKIDIYFGSVLTSFLSWMMAVAVTYTIFINGIKVTDSFTAALAIKPFAGDLAFILFGLGLFGASILGLSIVPLATAYVFSEMFGYEGSLDADFKKGKLFYSFFIIQILTGLLIALFPKTQLFVLTLYADFLNGAMLPLIFYFLIKFSQDKEIVGEYTTKGFSLFFLKLSALIISLAVLLTLIGKIFGF